MSLEPFIDSKPFTFGVELEMQIVNTHDYDLTKAGSDLLRLIKDEKIPGNITPEITESMIELSTGICTTHEQAVADLRKIRDTLVSAADHLNVGLCGGGTHAFQQWSERQIVDTPRFQYLSELYGYLAKQFTVFGQHVHIGCPDPNSALYLLHSMSRFIPHFIALSASSPFVQGVDTGFHSARLNSVFAFPLSGRAPFVLTWDSFEEYFSKMVHTGVVNSMKDFYWDIRPKPGFGTIEVRVMDTPLSVDRAAAIACYIQTLARHLLLDKPITPQEDDYLVYTFNRFEACRFGLAGTCINPQTGERKTISEDILETLDLIAPHAEALGSGNALAEIGAIARGQVNDATWLRGVVEREKSLHEAVRQQCLQWRA
ncbi:MULTISPECIES: YbdK family carboxylate-amine ligase [unclassified Paraburkholderia]|jgi:glutamate---cysteine ligase / carboxylate-amine ligase|uniref:YbdK family carboxylate-amine ligase n=1 Tax=unclassified Paraburkholderia TaxID=2615204 RepID=UPI000D07C2ED|nr:MULTISPECIES: YbdK family carboxylate-amine ligase [unclassified Paraburkholderia]PRX98355.1 carboxylate-amine ligase [Paraburkholderia sp. BL25I1N1]REG60457.1 carboxylate-amine ligase [Paraburkholderia sp. BL6669N2]RKR43681.1 carboxylate-amine ligase [Paraburkholderia sp. BL17N1]